jgi:hypothetical protein
MKAVEIYIDDTGKKEWVIVRFGQHNISDQEWFPRLEDVAYIARFLYEVEDKKYPPPAKGGEFVREFLNEAMDGISIMELMEKYKIPETKLHYYEKTGRVLIRPEKPKEEVVDKLVKNILEEMEDYEWPF